MTRWGKAGIRLDPKEAERRRKQLLAEQARTQASAREDNQVAYQRWRDGLVCPNRITMALDLNDLHGPEVDIACKAQEPEVDQWEAGERYPSWKQLCALADLTGFTPRWFTVNGEPPVSIYQTSIWFHMSKAEREAWRDKPLVMCYPRAVLDARPPTPERMPS